MSIPNIMERLINQPLFAHPASALVVFNSFVGRHGLSPAPLPASEHLPMILERIDTRDQRLLHGGTRTQINGRVDSSRFVGEFVRNEGGGFPRQEPYLRTAAGTAIITIEGTLVNRGGWVGANSGVTAYEGIHHQLDMAARNPKTGAILLDISTPGGEAMGNAELGDKIRAVNQVKPVYALVNSMACSAGYMIASSAREVFGTQSSLSGSIGCIMLHLDMTEAAAQQGVEPTLIIAGDHKADGHSLAKLTPEALGRLKSGVNAFYDIFLTGVAKGRGDRLNKKAARDTQAGTYIGREAVTAGLIDAIASFEQVLSAADKVSSKSLAKPRTKGTQAMSLLTVSADAPQGTTQEAPQPVLPPPTPAAPQPAPAAAGMDARTMAIIGHASVKANNALLMPALNLAAQSPTMSADQIVTFVASMAPAAPAAPPAPPPAPAAALPTTLTTADIAAAAAATGVNNIHAAGGATPTPPPGPGNHAPGSITLEAAPWGGHIDAINKRAEKWQPNYRG